MALRPVEALTGRGSVVVSGGTAGVTSPSATSCAKVGRAGESGTNWPTGAGRWVRSRHHRPARMFVSIE